MPAQSKYREELKPSEKPIVVSVTLQREQFNRLERLRKNKNLPFIQDVIRLGNSDLLERHGF